MPDPYNPWATPIFPGASAFGVGSPAEDAQRQPTIVDNLLSHIAGALGRGFMAPGQALQSTTPITSEQMIAPAHDMTTALVSGGMPMAERDALGMVGGKPTTFYRGVHPDRSERIATGKPEWDSNLFAADNLDAARMYGPSITEFSAKPDAKILYEGTQDFRKVAGGWRKDENLLEYADRAAKAAKAAGYDATWFKRQGDVGTAIHNPDAFIAKPFTEPK